MAASRRRLGGWGFEGQTFEPSQQLLAWLKQRIGPAHHSVPERAAAPPDVSAADVGLLPAEVSHDPSDCLAHARGQGLADVLRLRGGLVPALPDGVCRPRDAAEVARVLKTCASRGVKVIPWGGGTSVTGGVNVLAGEAPVVSLDLERLSGLSLLDEVSGLATFGPGTRGPDVEAALAAHRLTLGHFPQSWELATVGGWVVTRSSGQESLGYGRIEDMVAGLELHSPAGALLLAARPASAAGPDLARLVMGSEGRFGVVTEVTLRVRQRPPVTEVVGALLPDLERGLETVRKLVRDGVRLTMIRLSDSPETAVAMAVGVGASPVRPLIERYLRLRGVGDGACLLLFGAAGDHDEVGTRLDEAREIVRFNHGVSLGRRPGRQWLRDRFRHPYLRESLLDLGYATDTLETAAPWSAVTGLRDTVAAAIAGALEDDNERVAVLCHVSHPYRDGASLYFTFFFRCAGDTGATIARWARIKRAATEALASAGATLSHHHGIGQWHAPWLEREIGPLGRTALEAVAEKLDPSGIMNPRVLLDPVDRLES
jgi:alkyldihydroxyacetonephosphate synthase